MLFNPDFCVLFHVLFSLFHPTHPLVGLLHPHHQLPHQDQDEVQPKRDLVVANVPFIFPINHLFFFAALITRTQSSEILQSSSEVN